MRVYLEELRSSIRRRATESVQFPTDSELITEAKVCDFNVHISIQEEVLCLRGRKGGVDSSSRSCTYVHNVFKFSWEIRVYVSLCFTFRSR